MYLFKIKADASDIDIPVVRSLLVFAAIIITISRNNNIYALNIMACIALLTAAYMAEVILVKYKVHSLLFTGISALILALCTFNIVFPVIMMMIAIAIRCFYVSPQIIVEENGIRIKKTFSDKVHAWTSFNQVIVKDGLLSLDFKNNKVVQLELLTEKNFSEKGLNEYCNKMINE